MLRNRRVWGHRLRRREGQPLEPAAGAFPDARGGLVSTAADLLRFAQALLDGGGGVISPAAVIAMTTDHLTAGQRRGESAQAFLDGAG